MKDVILIRGPLGIGKTTISKMLADKHQGRHISIDEVVDSIEVEFADDGSGGIPLAKFIKANEIILPKIRENIEQSILTIIDGNFYHLEQVENLKQTLPEINAVTLKASVEECIDRDINRPKSYGEGAARAVHSMVSRFDYGEVIEVDGKTALEVLGEIERVLNL
ncbi:AAA family ATPase [Candidatus Peregrinibacteria bacterium]|nr:AAA family ATPase [Candidatus Peregrinibacteria bacterium]